MRAGGLLKDNGQCQEGARAAGALVYGDTDNQEAGDLAQQLGSAACNDAVPIGRPAAPAPLPTGMPPGAAAPTGMPPGAAAPTGVHPISACFIGSFPGHPSPHQFFLMSDGNFADATPGGFESFSSAMTDTTGQVALIAFDTPGHYWAFSHDGVIYLVILPAPAFLGGAFPVGRCT